MNPQATSKTHPWPTLNQLSNAVHIVLYAFCAWAVWTLVRTAPVNEGLDACAMLLFLGPGLALVDMMHAAQKTRFLHRAETLARLGLMLGLYTTMLPEWWGPPTAFGEKTTFSDVGQIVVWLGMYMVLLCGLHHFTIKPKRMIDTVLPLFIFFAGWLVTAMLVKHVGLWGMFFSCIGTFLAWRHALWYNARPTMSSEQHAHVWPELAKKSEESNDMRRLWEKLHDFSTTHMGGNPGVALSALSLPTLLGYFHPDTMAWYGKTKAFGEEVKAAITAKEPRAAVLWELYPDVEAAQWIADIETFSIPVNEQVALPAL